VFRAELLNGYEDLDCSVFDISTHSPFVLAAWRKDLRLPFALLSDYEREVCRDYQCLYDEFGGFKGVHRRTAYVIDREGTIRYSYICPDLGNLPDFEKIDQCLREIE
jgi:peroxiredoxin